MADEYEYLSRGFACQGDRDFHVSGYAHWEIVDKATDEVVLALCDECHAHWLATQNRR